MSKATENLIEALQHNARVSNGRPLEQRMADLAIWFHHNMSSIPLDNLAAKQKFLETAFWTMVEIQTLLLERLREGKQTSLYIPRGVQVEGDVRKFG